MLPPLRPSQGSPLPSAKKPNSMTKTRDTPPCHLSSHGCSWPFCLGAMELSLVLAHAPCCLRPGDGALPLLPSPPPSRGLASHLHFTHREAEAERGGAWARMPVWLLSPLHQAPSVRYPTSPSVLADDFLPQPPIHSPLNTHLDPIPPSFQPSQGLDARPRPCTLVLLRGPP